MPYYANYSPFPINLTVLRLTRTNKNDVYVNFCLMKKDLR